MTYAYSLSELPKSIPMPVDEGACDHLPGMRLPSGCPGRRFDPDFRTG